jgi:threonine aldolase
MPGRFSFASDNHFGAHPAVLEALARVNGGPVPAYGDDPVTALAAAKVRALFGGEAAVHFVFNGTAGNVLGLQALLQPWEAVICTDVAHIAVDECGAPERFAAAKLLTVPAPDGKLTPDLVRGQLKRIGDQHVVQPRVVSVTQSTEYGTVYTVEELQAITTLARAEGLRVHMDGARLANAAAALGLPVRAFTRDVGVDVVTFGATKNGALGAEAVVFMDPSVAATFPFIRKQGMQLASKMRFLAAQFLALLEDDRYLELARHANTMARRLAEGIRGVPGVRITQAVEANAVFAVVEPALRQRLLEEFLFYVWDEATGEVRWMASWATTGEDVDRFVAAVRREK